MLFIVQIHVHETVSLTGYLQAFYFASVKNKAKAFILFRHKYKLKYSYLFYFSCPKM
jgi:hypothetical protein